jgi:WhiB family redox-sensing transcriptional regulator
MRTGAPPLNPAEMITKEVTVSGLDWRHHAVCKEVDPELFFPSGHHAVDGPQVQAAKNVCAGCPVILECRQWAIESGQIFGIWGGQTEDERAVEIRNRPKGAKRRYFRRDWRDPK